jgi:hypothetical protein
MEYIYAVFYVLGTGWSMFPGLYPLQVDDCEAKAKLMLPTIEQIYNREDRISDYELGCITAENYDDLKAKILERYPPGEPS